MDPNGEREYKTNALGSGVIVDARKGYIITNNHVVEDMDNIKVKLFDKREYKAEIMGTDPKSDLAILKINAENFLKQNQNKVLLRTESSKGNRFERIALLLDLESAFDGKI